uniref:Large ribosomal subunit protein bL33c n=1 Tax=Polysiphonia infestans TaxID=2006978 RepID=A0A1Z1MEG2_9FLOR|nr:ribosomal protein L33 [Polysiphonia infestans]ARW64363.1 ribosomal protein L33 [Polysiphonia infestans]
MAKSKTSRVVITLECECRNKKTQSKRKKGIMRYSTCKNKKNTPNRLEINKFCSYCKKHSLFKEIK